MNLHGHKGLAVSGFEPNPGKMRISLHPLSLNQCDTTQVGYLIYPWCGVAKKILCRILPSSSNVSQDFLKRIRFTNLPKFP